MAVLRRVNKRLQGADDPGWGWQDIKRLSLFVWPPPKLRSPSQYGTLMIV